MAARGLLALGAVVLAFTAVTGQPVCTDDQYQTALLVTKCDTQQYYDLFAVGQVPAIFIGQEEEVLLRVPVGYQIRFQVHFDLAVDLNVSIWDDANEHCIIGTGCPQEVVWTPQGLEEKASVVYQGMTFEVVRKSTQWLSLHTPNAGLDYPVSIRAVSTRASGFSQLYKVTATNVKGTGSAGGMSNHCFDPPPCANCSAYSKCSWGQTPACNGTTDVRCETSTSTSSSTTWSTSTTTFTTSTSSATSTTATSTRTTTSQTSSTTSSSTVTSTGTTSTLTATTSSKTTVTRTTVTRSTSTLTAITSTVTTVTHTTSTTRTTMTTTSTTKTTWTSTSTTSTSSSTSTTSSSTTVTTVTTTTSTWTTSTVSTSSRTTSTTTTVTTSSSTSTTSTRTTITNTTTETTTSSTTETESTSTRSTSSTTSFTSTTSTVTATTSTLSTSTASTSTVTSSTSSTKTTVSTSTTSTTWSTTTSTSNSTTTTSSTVTTSSSTTTSNTTTTTMTTTSSSSSSTLSTTTTTLVPCDPGDYLAVSRSCTGHWSSCTSNCEPCSWYSGCGSLQTPMCNGSSAVLCQSPFALVEAATALWPGAATTAAATLSLEVDGTWEPAEPFFDSATTGQVFNLSLPVASWPTRLRFSLSTSDAWGIQWLRFSVGPRMQYVLQSMSPQGAPFKVEPHWVGNGSFARTYTVPQEVGVRVAIFIRGVDFATLEGNHSLRTLFVDLLQDAVIAEAGRFVSGDLASTQLKEAASGGVFAEVTLPAELPLAASACLHLQTALAAPGERALQGMSAIPDLERALSAERALLSISTVLGLELSAENVSVSMLPEASGVLLEMALDTDLHFSSQVESNQSTRDELEEAARQEIAANAGRPLSEVLVTASHDPSVAGRVWVDALVPMEPALAVAVLASLRSKLAGSVPKSVLRMLPPGSSSSSSSRMIPEAASGAWVELRLEKAQLTPMADELGRWAALERLVTEAVAGGAERPVAALSTSLVQGHDNAWYLDAYVAAEPALGAAICLQLQSAALGSSVLTSARALPALAPLLPSDAAVAAKAELVPEVRGFLASMELPGFDFGELESSPSKKEQLLRAAEGALLQALGRPLLQSGPTVTSGSVTSSLSPIPGGVLVDTLLSCEPAVAAALLTAVRAAGADVGNAVLAAASAVPGVRLPGAPASHPRVAGNMVPKATGVGLHLAVENVHLEALHDAGRAALHAAIREAMTLRVGGPFAAELLSTSVSARPGGGVFLDAFLHAELPLAAAVRNLLHDASAAIAHAVQSEVRTVAVGAGSIPAENVAIELVPEAKGVAVRTVLAGSGAGAALQNATFRRQLLRSLQDALWAHAGRPFQEVPSQSVSQGANGAVYVDTLIPADELALSAVVQGALQDSMAKVARETLAGLPAGDTRIESMAPFLVPPSKVQGVSIKVLMPDLDPASLSGSRKDALREVLRAVLLNATGRASSGHVLSTSLTPLGSGVVFDALVTAEPALAAALFAALQRNVSTGLGREVAHRVQDVTQLAVAEPSIAAGLIPQATGLSVSMLIKGVNETELQSNGASRAAFVSVVHNALLASAEREVPLGALATQLSSSGEGLRVDTLISTEPGLAAALRAKLLNASATLSAEVIRGAMGVKGVAAPSKVTAEGLGAELVPQAMGVWVEMKMGGLGTPMSQSVRSSLLRAFGTAVAKNSGRRLPSNASVVITQAPNGTAFLDCFLPVPSGYSNAASIAASLGSSSAALAAEVAAGVEGAAAESAVVRMVPEVTGVHLAFPVTEAVADVLRGSQSKLGDLQAAVADAVKELENMASKDGWATGFSEATGGGDAHLTLFVPGEPSDAAKLKGALQGKYGLLMQLVKGKAQAVGVDAVGIRDALITLVPQATSPQATTTKAHAEATSGKPTTTDVATTTTLQESATTSVGRGDMSTSTTTTFQAWVLSSWGVCLPTACGSGLRSRLVSCPGDGLHCNLTAPPPWQEVCHDESMCCDSPFYLFPETGWFDCDVQHWLIVILLLLLLLCCCSCLTFLICFRFQKRMSFRRYELEKTQVTETHEAREISIQADETTLPWEARVICPAPEKPVPSVSEAPMEMKEEVLGPVEIIQVIGEPPGHFEVVKVGPSEDPGLRSVLPVDRPLRQDGSRGHRDNLWDIPNEAVLQATVPVGQQIRVPSRDPSRKRRSGDPKWEQAMSIVDRTTRELSRLMADARAAPRRRKPELFQKMRELESDPEYVQAKHYLEEDGKIETGKGVLNFCCGAPVADQLARHAGPSPRTFSNLQAVCSEASACSDATAFLGMEDDLFNGNRQDYAMAL